MKFGLIGGVGPQATVPYYLGIVNGVQKATGRPYFPRLTVESLSCFDVIGLSSEGRLEELTQYLLSGLASLAAAGCDCAALSCVTGHVVFDELERRSPLPLISLLAPTVRAMVEGGVCRAGLLGTGPTMQSAYFRRTFATQGVSLLTPEGEDFDWVARVIPEELEYGRVTEKTLERFGEISERLARAGCEALVLGCTELPLVFGRLHSPVPAWDPIPLHIEAIVRRITEETSV